MLFDEYTVVVRSVGERTEKKCIERLKHFFKTDDIKIVRNVTPFTKAIQKTFDLAIETGREWCLVVDADVLFYEEKLYSFLWNCNQIKDFNDKIFCFQAYLYDNFWEKCRLAGVHLFRTKWMQLAFPYIENEKGRPESWVVRNMSWQGYPCYIVDMSIGIHDFFQSYRDIVAKGMLHAQKHSNIDSLIHKWKVEQQYNKDYEWILKGIELIRHAETDVVIVDADYYKQQIAEAQITFPLQDTLKDREIEQILQKTCKIEFYHEMVIPQTSSPNDEKTWIQRLRSAKKSVVQNLAKNKNIK